MGDGFQGRADGIVVLAATNRPEVLDPALTRPGRLDRHVVVPLPDVHGREAILKVHSRKKNLSSNVNLFELATKTPEFSGADLAQLMNESAILAIRHGCSCITDQCVQEALSRVTQGKQSYVKRDKASDPAT